MENVKRVGPNLMQGRYKLSDGRFADHNGTFEEKFLYYFMAHTESEGYYRGIRLDNETYREENLALRKKVNALQGASKTWKERLKALWSNLWN